MTCPNCGRQLPDGSVYCMGCGARFRYAATTETQMRNSRQARQEAVRRRGKLIVAVSALVLVLAAAVSLLYIFVLSHSARYDNRMDAASNYYLTGAFESAAEAYAEALKQQPQSAEARFGLAESLAKTARWEEAVAEYLTLREQAPDFEGLAGGLMSAYMGMERWDEAYALIESGEFGPEQAGYSSIVRSLSASCLTATGFSADAADLSVLASQLLGTASAGEWSIADGTLFISVDRGEQSGFSYYSFSQEHGGRIYSSADAWLSDAGETSRDWTELLNVSYDGKYASLMLDSYSSHLRSLGVLSTELSADLDGDGEAETVYVVSDFRASWRAALVSSVEDPTADPLSTERNSGLMAIVADLSGDRLYFRPVCVTAEAEITTESVTEDGELFVFTRQWIYSCRYSDSDSLPGASCMSVARRYNTGSLRVLRYTAGETAVCDIDGDGADESVLLTFEGNKALLMLDGVLFEDADGLLGDASKDWYYITDIDSSDDAMELAVVTGSGDAAQTRFFSSGGAGLVYIGSVSGRPGVGGFELDGGGSVLSRKNLSILQRWTAPCVWSLTEAGLLEEAARELWYPDSGGKGVQVTVKKAFSAFASNDLLSDSVRVREGSVLTFTATDNAFWISFETDRDVEGWIYLPDGQSIVTGDETVSANSLFSGLNR